MPIYTYHPETPDDGTTPVERIFNHPPPTFIKVDGMRYKRAEVEPMAVIGLKPEPSQGEQVLRGYYDLECAHKLHLPRGFNAERVKETWENDAPTEAELAGDRGDQEAAVELVKRQHAVA